MKASPTLGPKPKASELSRLCEDFCHLNRHNTFRRNTGWNHSLWPSAQAVLQQEVLVKNTELTSHHQPEELRKGQKERGDDSPYVLPESSALESILSEWCHQEGPWVRMTDQRQPGNESPHPRPRATCRAVLPGPHPAALARASLPNDVSCFVSTRVSSDNSFLSLDESPLSGPGRGPSSCHRTGQELTFAELSTASNSPYQAPSVKVTVIL